MKKLCLNLLIAAATCTIARAQTQTSTPSATTSPKLGVGLDVGLPLGVGGLNNFYSIGFGGAGKLELPVSSSFNFTFTTGYMTYYTKDEVYAARQAYSMLFNRKISKNDGFIPVKAGGKYYLVPNFYAEAEVGVNFGVNNNSGNSFIYAPGFGLSYPVADGRDLDVGVRYEGWSQSGGNNGQIALRLAYKFGI
jgi:hypothetical protein